MSMNRREFIKANAVAAAAATAGIAVATAMASKASMEISATAPPQAARRPGAKRRSAPVS